MVHMTRHHTYSPQALARIEQARAAIRKHDYLSLNALLANGMNPNMPATDGRYLVHDAVMFDANGTAVDILTHYHADINARWSAYQDWTPAHIAWASGRADLVEKLRRLGADLSLEDSQGWSAQRALPCPITRMEARRRFAPFAGLVSHTTENPAFA
jgi:ankyrin repeat protein